MRRPGFEEDLAFYGWVWLLLLHAELASWDDPQAQAWAGHMEPAADLVAERLAEYLTGQEAALMAESMDQDDYVPWLDSLLPHMDSKESDPWQSGSEVR